MLHLAPYSPEHNQALSYTLDVHQAVFTALPESWFDGSGEHVLRVSIMAGGLAVGFFVLDGGGGKVPFTPNPNALLLRSMSVNPEHQGKGYAKAALCHPDLPPLSLSLLPDADEIVLGVNVRNRAAAQVYAACGFADTGRRYQGPQGEQIIMSRPLPF